MVLVCKHFYWVFVVYPCIKPIYCILLLGKKPKKKSITKADIGTPQNFVHVSHVGWDPTTGFDLARVDPSMREFFDKVMSLDLDH